jgi:hypothetical protein
MLDCAPPHDYEKPVEGESHANHSYAGFGFTSHAYRIPSNREDSAGRHLLAPAILFDDIAGRQQRTAWLDYLGLSRHLSRTGNSYSIFNIAWNADRKCS